MSISPDREMPGDKNGATPARSPCIDELRLADSREPTEPTEIDRIAGAQVQLLGCLARLAVAELHDVPARSRSDRQS